MGFKIMSLILLINFTLISLTSQAMLHQFSSDHTQLDNHSRFLMSADDILANQTRAQQSNETGHNWPILSLSLFSVFGIFGNVLVCLTISRDHTLQTKTNYYLYSLAIADLAVCLIVLPLSIVQDFSGPWPFNLSTCTIWIFLDILLCTSSIYHLSAVAILRFVAIQYPFRSSRTTSRQLTYFILFLIWTFSIVLSSPIIYLGYKDAQNVMDNEHRCYLRNHKFALFGSIFSFVIPLFIMIAMFALMVRKLRQQLAKQDNISITSMHNKKNHDSDLLSIARSHFSFHSRRYRTPTDMRDCPSIKINENNESITVLINYPKAISEKRPSTATSISSSSSAKNKQLQQSQQLLRTTTNSMPEYLSHSCNISLRKESNSGGNFATTNSPNMSTSRKVDTSGQLRRHGARAAMMHSPYFKSSITSSFSNPAGFNNNRQLSKQLSTQLSQEVNSSFQNFTMLNKSIAANGRVNSKLSTMSRKKSFDVKNSILGNMGQVEVQNEVKALQVLGIVFIAFIIAWFPYCIVNITAAICDLYRLDTTKFHEYINYLTYLGYFSSTFNPIIYTVFNRKFRRNFLEILKCSSNRKRKFNPHTYYI